MAGHNGTRPKWINDSQALVCAVCSVGFSFLNRKVSVLACRERVADGWRLDSTTVGRVGRFAVVLALLGRRSFSTWGTWDNRECVILALNRSARLK
jgi:hypothetical protein